MMIELLALCSILFISRRIILYFTDLNVSILLEFKERRETGIGEGGVFPTRAHSTQ